MKVNTNPQVTSNWLSGPDPGFYDILLEPKRKHYQTPKPVTTINVVLTCPNYFNGHMLLWYSTI